VRGRPGSRAPQGTRCGGWRLARAGAGAVAWWLARAGTVSWWLAGAWWLARAGAVAWRLGWAGAVLVFGDYANDVLSDSFAMPCKGGNGCLAQGD
jgi:hypothetical protein